MSSFWVRGQLRETDSEAGRDRGADQLGRKMGNDNLKKVRSPDPSLYSRDDNSHTGGRTWLAQCKDILDGSSAWRVEVNWPSSLSRSPD